jgi:hypothetical protein
MERVTRQDSRCLKPTILVCPMEWLIRLFGADIHEIKEIITDGACLIFLTLTADRERHERPSKQGLSLET